LDQISGAHDSGTPVEGRVVEVVEGGLAVDVGVRASCPARRWICVVKNLASLRARPSGAKVIKLNRRRATSSSPAARARGGAGEKKKQTLSVLAEAWC